MRSWEKRLQSLRNSFMPDLLAMNFLARSKKASSSDVALEVDVGGRGSGMIGVKVGETAGTSGAFGLWFNLVLCLSVSYKNSVTDIESKRIMKAPEMYLVRRAALGNSPGAFSDDISLRSRNGRIIVTRPLLTLLVRASRDCEVPNRRHLGFVSILGGLVECSVFCCFRSCRCFGLSSRFGQKLLEIFKKVRS
jgi:hypothetical protein